MQISLNEACRPCKLRASEPRHRGEQRDRLHRLREPGVVARCAAPSAPSAAARRQPPRSAGNERSSRISESPPLPSAESSTSGCQESTSSRASSALRREAHFGAGDREHALQFAPFAVDAGDQHAHAGKQRLVRRRRIRPRELQQVADRPALRARVALHRLVLHARGARGDGLGRDAQLLEHRHHQIVAQAARLFGRDARAALALQGAPEPVLHAPVRVDVDQRAGVADEHAVRRTAARRARASSGIRRRAGAAGTRSRTAGARRTRAHRSRSQRVRSSGCSARVQPSPSACSGV